MGTGTEWKVHWAREDTDERRSRTLIVGSFCASKVETKITVIPSPKL